MRKLNLFLLGLLLCLGELGAQSFREQFTEANLLSEDGYYGLAIPIWLQLLEEEPKNANLNYKIGRCYLDMGIDRDQSLPYLVKASKGVKRIYDPFSSDFKGAPVETYFYLGKAHHITTNLDSAEHFYQKFLDDASKKHYLRPEAERGLQMCTVARNLMQKPVDVNIVNLGSPINSGYAEYSPIIAYDENTLYFTSRRLRTDSTNRSSIEATTGLYYEDMYVSYRNIRGKWMNPELLPINVATKHSSVVSMSPDGHKLYIYKIFGEVGNIYESNFVLGQGWSEPSLVGSNVNSTSNEYFATITSDGQRLYFVSDRKGGKGGKDIWYVQRLPNGEWGKAINLGEPINTADDEDSPYLHPDGKTMYFSSNGPGSMGGYDVFYSQIGEDGEWQTPINIGYPINTTDDDHSYISTPSGRRSYYASKGTNSMGSTDIYVIEYEEEEEEAPEVDLGVFAVVKGWIFPPPGEELPDDILITINEIGTGAYSGEARPVKRNGSFVFIIPSGGTYSIEFSMGENIVYKEEITIPQGKQYQELSREIFLKPSKGDRLKIVALRDEVLGDVIRWKIDMLGTNESVPLGSRVLYLDGDSNVLDTAYVSKDGFFEFRQLSDEQDYILMPELTGLDRANLNIRLIDNNNEVRPIDMIEVNHVFYEKGKEPAIVTHEASRYFIRIGDGSEAIEEGTVIKFMDETGEVVYTEIVRKDGSFFYHQLLGDKNFRLQLVSSSDIDAQVVVVETFQEKEVRVIPLSSVNSRLFDTRSPLEAPGNMPIKEVKSEYYVIIGQKGHPIPTGTMIKFYSPDAALLFTEIVRPNGTFVYHTLPNGEDCALELIAETDISDRVWIEEIRDGSSVRIIHLNRHDAHTYSTLEKPVAAATPAPAAVNARSFRISFDYNKSGVVPSQEEIQKAVDAIEREVEQNGIAKLVLEASASRVPTSLKDGNEGLAKSRLQTGKTALFKALEQAGIDMNKISTIAEKSGVNGPAYEPKLKQQKSLFIDYQYFKVSLN